MWEVVNDDHGRQYYWNTDTDEVSWEVPLDTKEIPANIPVDVPKPPPVPPRRDYHVRARLSILDHRVCLQLKACHEKHLMTDRLWLQLREREREFLHLARTTRITTLDFYLNAHYRRILTFAFRSWERVCSLLQRRELEQCTIMFTRWYHEKKYADTILHALRKLSLENKSLTNELVQCKIQFASASFEVEKIRS
jgi:hypothetical protein